MGINKPSDRVFKSFLDEAPRLFLHLLDVVRLNEEATITVLRPETAPPVVLPDYIIRVEQPGKAPFIFHCELEHRFRADKQEAWALYGTGLATQHRIKIHSAILLLHPGGGEPKSDEDIAELDIHGSRLLHPYRIFRLWELDPEAVLDYGNIRLLAWAVLMKSTDWQVREIGAALGGTGDHELLARFYLLGGIRYDRERLEEMTTASRNELIEFLWDKSSVLKDAKAKILTEGLAEGLAKGQAQGQAQGQALEARRLLRSALAAKFPGLETMPQIDAITDLAVLESLFIGHVLTGQDRAAVQRAIETAV